MFDGKPENLVNLSCSIQNYYGIKPSHATLTQVDGILYHKHKHIVVIILSGIGMSILEKHLSYRDFLRRRLLTDYSSVFPSSTQANILSFFSGKNPVEQGLFSDGNDTLSANTTQNLFDCLLDSAENLINQINKKGTAKAYGIFSYGNNSYQNLYDWTKDIKKTLASDEKTFTCAFWEQADLIIREFGENSNEAEKAVRDLNAALLALCEASKDTLFLITSDHGNTSIQNVFFEDDYPDFAEMLERPVGMEARALNLFVKDECKEVFSEKFKEHFGDDYQLFTREEAIKNELFGDSFSKENHKLIGDFVAAALSSKTIIKNKEQKQSRSLSGGLTKAEMKIPLIWYETKIKRAWMVVYYSIIGLLVAFLIFILVH